MDIIISLIALSTIPHHCASELHGERIARDCWISCFLQGQGGWWHQDQQCYVLLLSPDGSRKTIHHQWHGNWLLCDAILCTQMLASRKQAIWAELRNQRRCLQDCPDRYGNHHWGPAPPWLWCTWVFARVQPSLTKLMTLSAECNDWVLKYRALVTSCSTVSGPLAQGC